MTKKRPTAEMLSYLLARQHLVEGELLYSKTLGKGKQVNIEICFGCPDFYTLNLITSDGAVYHSSDCEKHRPSAAAASSSTN